MKDSSDSTPPRRLGATALLAIAALSIILFSPLPEGRLWSAPAWLAPLVAFALLAAYLFVLPATFRYDLMVLLRRRERSEREPACDHEAGWRGGICWVDVGAPLLATALLSAGAWTALAAWRAAGGVERVSGAGWLAAVAVAAALALLGAYGLGAAAVRSAESPSGRWVDRLVRGAAGVLQPLMSASAWVVERLVEPVEAAAPSSPPEDDLADVIEVESHQGDLSIVQSELLRRELDFARKTAADVMVPRVDVDYLDLDMSLAEVRQHLIQAPFSRYPVKYDSVDNVVAVLHAKDLLRFTNGDAPESLRKLLALTGPRPPLHVSHSLSLDDVLETLKRAQTSLAIVDDEYGGVAGILTVEDVVEELVGEIVDESDAVSAPDSVVCSGRRRLAELREVGIELPGDPEQTVAEFLAERLETEPRAGQVLAIDSRRVVVEATDADGAIEVVRIEQHWQPSTTAATG